MGTQSMLDNRAAHEAKVKAQLDRLDAKLDELKAKAAGAEADARIRYNSLIEQLSVQREAWAKKLQTFQQAGEGAWQEIAQGLDTAWQELEAAFQRAGTKL